MLCAENPPKYQSSGGIGARDKVVFDPYLTEEERR